MFGSKSLQMSEEEEYKGIMGKSYKDSMKAS